MSRDKLSLFVFIDAFGWDILNSVQFFDKELPYRRKLESVLGYSSTAIPTILTGRWPYQHGHFSFYFYSPQTSPFKGLSWMRALPKKIKSSGRVRNKISQALKRIYGYSGYFQIYNMPFQYMHMFDYCEKKSLFEADGILKGDSIFTTLELSGINYHASDWRKSEEENYKAVTKAIDQKSCDWAFFYNANLDGIMHVYKPGSNEALNQIDAYRKRLSALFKLAEERYAEVDLFVFSDHGMATVNESYELWRDIEALGFSFGRDYTAVYDSTMARFWFMNHDARRAIKDVLLTKDYGRILPDDELRQYGAYFEDHKYGELFFLLKEGCLIVPSFMGQKPIAAMHGYHPTDPASYAMIISNKEIPEEIRHIKDINILMSKAIQCN